MNETNSLSITSQTLNQLFSVQWPWLELLLLSSLGISLLVAGLAIYLVRRGNRQRNELQQTCRQLSHDLQIAGSSAIGMGQRIVALERRLANQTTATTPSQPVTHTATPKAVPRPAPATVQLQTVKPAADPATTVIDEARELLRKGMSEQEVAKRCGLSDSETALMAMVMRQQGLAAVG